jgi:hypothetical protein
MTGCADTGRPNRNLKIEETSTFCVSKSCNFEGFHWSWKNFTEAKKRFIILKKLNFFVLIFFYKSLDLKSRAGSGFKYPLSRQVKLDKKVTKPTKITRARICIWSPGIHTKELIAPASVACRPVRKLGRVVVRTRKFGHRTEKYLSANTFR